jgi:hypothetical protein
MVFVMVPFESMVAKLPPLVGLKPPQPAPGFEPVIPGIEDVKKLRLASARGYCPGCRTWQSPELKRPGLILRGRFVMITARCVHV